MRMLMFQEVERARNLVSNDPMRYSARTRIRMNDVYRRATVSEFFSDDDDAFVLAILEGQVDDRRDSRRVRRGYDATRSYANVCAVNFA